MQDGSLLNGRDISFSFENDQDINDRAILDQLLHDFLVDV